MQDETEAKGPEPVGSEVGDQARRDRARREEDYREGA